MDPVKAYRLGVDPNELVLACHGQKYRGKWVISVKDAERGKIIITESHDLYEMCWWIAQLRMLVNGS